MNLKIRHGAIVENTVIDLYTKFDYDRLQNENVLVLWKSDNNKDHKNKNNICSHSHCCSWVQKSTSPSNTHTMYCYFGNLAQR